MTIQKNLVAASSVPLLLSILAGGESYGYAIIQRVRQVSGGRLEWNEGMLYPVLHRLERDELIASKWGEAASGRRRRYYRITAKGRAELARSREEWFCVHETLERLWEGDACPT